LTKVRIGEHRYINVSRRSLCDNCEATLCNRNRSGRVMDCDDFRPVFLAFKKCSRCEKVFDVFSNISSLDQELCPDCNKNKGP
jgi:hypothetical protein